MINYSIYLFYNLCGRLLQNRVTEDHLASGVSEVKVAYLGESVEGDVLDIEVWCPEENTAVCSMTKEGKVICQVTLTYNLD
jgi:hypothetical protein